MLEPKKYYGNYRGIVIQNNDPLYSGRIKVFVPSVNVNILEKWINNFENDDIINHVGENVNGFSPEIMLKLKKVLPWSGTCLPLIGMGTNGFYNSPSHQSILTNDSNQSGQQKANLTKQCEDKKQQETFKEIGKPERPTLSSNTTNIDSVQVTTYGYPSDPHLDTQSKKGIGNHNNKLISGESVALSEKTAKELNLKKGDSLYITFGDGQSQKVKYDDTIPAEYTNHRVDFYLKTDKEKSTFPHDGALAKLSKEQPNQQVAASAPSGVIMPPTYISEPTCNQGSGGIAPQAFNTKDLKTYTGTAGMDNHTKTIYPNESYRNPNDFRGANNLKPDTTLSLRPVNHSNNWKGVVSIPAVGSHVWVFFENGDAQYPVVFGYHANQEAFLKIHGITRNKEDQYFN